MARLELRSLPPTEAVKFFRAKGFKIGFAWQDVWQEEHTRAFTVAKAMRYDILRDIRAAVDDALAKGTTLAQFREQLEPTLQAKGWWGKKLETDPLTGKTKVVQLGSPRRLKTIYNVNLRMAYAAGAWERAERAKKRRPFLRYVQVDRPSKREEHAPWHGTVLRMDDPWWDSHYPPNGWGCGCHVIQLSKRDLERFGFKESERAPRVRRKGFRNPRTGQVLQVPEGIDPGFAYNVGKSHMRGLVPPPRGGSSVPPLIGPAAEGPLPTPRSAPASHLLPDDLTDQEYLKRFLLQFGATLTRPAVFTDAIGEPLVISADLFRGGDGKIKIRKRGRERSLLLLADTIKAPDEIWWIWEEFPRGGMTLLRRYLARWDIEGESAPVMALFDVGKDGWRGVTAFRADRVSYLENQRGGTLAYRRE